MRTTATIAVTGFGPFPGMARNPSAEVARLLAGSPRLRRLGIALPLAILPTAYGGLGDRLNRLCDVVAPQAVLMIGVAGRAATLRIERQAIRQGSRLRADAKGHTAPMAHSGPPVRRTPVAVDEAIHRLRRRGLSTKASMDAGRYLCNAAYYVMLGRRPALFIHIPLTASAGRMPRHRRRGPSPPTARAIARALEDVILALLVPAARRTAVQPQNAPTASKSGGLRPR